MTPRARGRRRPRQSSRCTGRRGRCPGTRASLARCALGVRARRGEGAGGVSGCVRRGPSGGGGTLCGSADAAPLPRREAACGRDVSILRQGVSQIAHSSPEPAGVSPRGSAVKPPPRSSVPRAARLRARANSFAFPAAHLLPASWSSNPRPPPMSRPMKGSAPRTTQPPPPPTRAAVGIQGGGRQNAMMYWCCA
jgi:hypothetical protein